MERPTDIDIPDARPRVGYLDALKIVALPVGSVVGVLAVVFWFAAGAYIRGIVQEEITALETGSTESSTTLTKHASRLTQHDEEIEDNEEDIDENREEFRDFVRDVIAKL